MKMRTVIGLAAGALAAAAAPAWATNGTRLIGVGAHAIARGGVDVGIADDATALHTNPAGIGFIDGQRFDSLTVLAFPSLTFEGPSDKAKSEARLPIFGGAMAAAVDFEEPWHLGEVFRFEDEAGPRMPSRYDPAYGKTGNGLKFGVGVFPIAGNKIDLDFTTPFWDADAAAGLARDSQRYQTDLAEVAITVGVAWRITEYLSVGIAPSFIYSRLEFDQPTAAPTSILAGHPLTNDPNPPPGELTYDDFSPALGLQQIEGYGDVDDAVTYGFRLRVGLLFAPLDWLSIGLTYSTQSFKQDYLGETTIDFDRQLQKLEGVDLGGVLAGQTLRDVIATNTGIPVADQSYVGRGNARISPFDAPQEIGLGVALRFDRVLLGFDLYWLNWSATYDAVTIEIENNTSAELNELTGDTRTTQEIEIPLDWDDQIVFAVGGAVAITPWWVVRAGYNYGKNPVPADTLQPSAPGILEHHVTAGMSFYYKRFELSVVAEYALPNRVRIDESRANRSLDGHELELSAFFVGLGIGVRF